MSDARNNKLSPEEAHHALAQARAALEASASKPLPSWQPEPRRSARPAPAPAVLLPSQGVLAQRPSMHVPSRTDKLALLATPEGYRAIFGVTPQIVKQPARASDELPTLPVDPELGRLAVALRLAAQLRLWIVAHQLVRESGGSGWIERAELIEALGALGIRYTEQHLRRLLKSGAPVFWNYNRKRLYVRSWARVGSELYKLAADARIGRTGRNKPGVRLVQVDVTGELEAFEAQIYAAWMTHRENPTISRSELEKLFGRDQTTLREWEREHLAGQLTVRANYAQTPDPQGHIQHIPHYAFEYVANVKHRGVRQRVVRVRWRLPNTYQAGAMRQHPHRGQSAKVRRRINLLSESPADERRGGSHRLYFEDPRSLKRHLGRDPDSGARYVWRGENQHLDGIFELNDNGFPLTHSFERASRTDEVGELLRIEAARSKRTLSPGTRGVSILGGD